MRKKRIESIDVLRGIVMIIMALDHVRYYFHYDAFFYSATNISQTTPILFFTRFITHFCAPVFLFLSGCSAFLVGKRKTKNELSVWLLKRGFWLLLVTFTIEKFGWSFYISPYQFDLAVLWSLGASMIVLAGVIFLPLKIIVGSAVGIIFFQHMFDSFNPVADNFFSVIWKILHVPGSVEVAGIKFAVAFPLLPWIAVMMLGYSFGKLYTNYDEKKRFSLLLKIGLITLVAFFVLRIINIYGDQNPWKTYDTLSKTIMSFFNVSKAPASFGFINLTIGISILFLAYIEKYKNKVTDFCITFGRTPFFFYILHIYVIHIGAFIFGYFQGYNVGILKGWISSLPYLKGYGVNLTIVYIIWIIVVVFSLPLCKRFYSYKLNHNNFISKYF